jgi:hypothetical protein
MRTEPYQRYRYPGVIFNGNGREITYLEYIHISTATDVLSCLSLLYRFLNTLHTSLKYLGREQSFSVVNFRAKTMAWTRSCSLKRWLQPEASTFLDISPTLALQHDAAGDQGTRRPRLLKNHSEKARKKFTSKGPTRVVYQNQNKTTPQKANQQSNAIAANRINNDVDDGEEEGSGSSSDAA